MRQINDQAQTGIVAVLDALGASHYRDDEIRKFMQSRQTLLKLLEDKAEFVADSLSVETIETFTFNDTILFVLKSTRDDVGIEKEIRAFLMVMRKFLADSLLNGILFRGALAIGKFHMDRDSNTILGQAVTDAAAWYDKTEWMGLVATPRASITIQRFIELNLSTWQWDDYMPNYDVPLNDGSTVTLKAVNWPKAFVYRGLTECCRVGDVPRARLLELLSQHMIPLGVEKKYFNTIRFFDHVIPTQTA